MKMNKKDYSVCCRPSEQVDDKEQQNSWNQLDYVCWDEIFTVSDYAGK